jgi:glycosyltransferase involved in cell wall biosynthesis
MTKVLMVVSPTKRAGYVRMATEFSENMEQLVFTPAYPHVDSATSKMSASDTIQQKLLGDPQLHKIFNKFDPDVIFTDTALYATHSKLRSIIERKTTPLLIHLLGDWWSEYWSWFSSSHWRKRIFASQQFVYNWSGLAIAEKILPVCKWLERVTHHYLPQAKTEVLHVGVEPDEFYEQSGMELHRPAVAIIQNHTVYQKVEGLLQFKTITDKLTNIHFYIAEGQAFHQRYLPQVKSTYSSSKNVHFVKEVNNVEKVRLMLTASDCYVLASGLDCSPVTILEASLLRRPVIASNIGGVPELIQENVTGWAINNTDIDTWLDRIRSVTSDPKLARRVGNSGRQWVSENFAWQVIAKQLEKTIGQAIN